MLQEVADTDSPYPPRLVEILHGPPTLGIGLFPPMPEPFRIRPVDKVEVKIIEAQSLKRLLESFLGLVAAPDRVPEFAGYKDLFPRDPAFPHGPAYTHLVAVNSRRINMAVPVGQRIPHCVVSQLPFRSLPCAQPNTRDFHAVFQSVGVSKALHVSTPLPYKLAMYEGVLMMPCRLAIQQFDAQAQIPYEVTVEKCFLVFLRKSSNITRKVSVIAKGVFREVCRGPGSTAIWSVS
jgi:hypothetical protein